MTRRAQVAGRFAPGLKSRLIRARRCPAVLEALFGWIIPPLLCWLVAVCFNLLPTTTADATELPFNDGWQFIRTNLPAAALNSNDPMWQTVTLPHTAHVEPLADGHEPRQWQGVCWYKKSFELPASAAGKDVFLRFDGAMNVADVWVNGQPAGHFMGGYLPYVMDVSRWVQAGETNVVAVRLDNRDNPITGPKPLADLDFNLYGGLYRDAHLIIQNRLHITDPILADTPAGGGVFVTFPSVTQTAATLDIKTQVKNDAGDTRHFTLSTTLLDASGKIAATIESPDQLAPDAAREFEQQLSVPQPRLWSPGSPYLYSVRSELIENGQAVDTAVTPVGIRRIEITRDGFFINGEKMFLRGCNRHQEYPFIGNALSDAAQYRDALKIKEAGFDYVRLSHYPQSPAFLAACDELGLVVMDSILGWQYFNPDPAFAHQKFQEMRQLIRRDRNHPCVILWELSLNESDMPADFIRRANAIGHEEYPGDQCYTAGWKRGYDVFMQARQHGGCRGITNVPCLISEYGDWEYYAQNAGLNQEKWADLKPAERSSRQFRGDGEVRLLQQAMNFQEAHNDDLQTTAFADGIWVMFDYSRGYAPDLESSGVMDVFRLPKFSYWFFRSQRDPAEKIAGKEIGPVVFIANDWTAASPHQVRVFSNCEEVALYANGKLIARRSPDTGRTCTHLKHPPYTFDVPQFEPGTLKAVGYLGGRAVASDVRRTPGPVTQLELQWNLGGQPFAANGKDAAFVHASLQDRNGTLVGTNGPTVFWGSTPGLKFMGNQPAAAEAGIASTLVEADQAGSTDTIYALCVLPEGDQVRIVSAAQSPGGDRPPGYVVRYTTDGSEPSAGSALYSLPIPTTQPIRAAIFVNGRRIVENRADAVAKGD